MNKAFITADELPMTSDNFAHKVAFAAHQRGIDGWRMGHSENRFSDEVHLETSSRLVSVSCFFRHWTSDSAPVISWIIGFDRSDGFTMWESYRQLTTLDATIDDTFDMADRILDLIASMAPEAGDDYEHVFRSKAELTTALVRVN